MSNLGQSAGNVGIQLIDTVGQIIDGFGDRIENVNSSDAARIEYMRTQSQINAFQVQSSERRKQQLTQAIIYVVFILLIALIGFTALKQLKK